MNKLDYPALDNRPVTEAHARYCKTNGHATHVVDETVVAMCPRCGEIKSPTVIVSCEYCGLSHDSDHPHAGWSYNPTASERRFKAIGDITRIWYNGDGILTAKPFDFKTLRDEVTRLEDFGRSAKWRHAIAQWLETIERAVAMFYDVNEFEAWDKYPLRINYTRTTQESYDHYFTWALFNNTTHAYC